MSNYQDRWGRYHHKVCIDGEPSSNNGWVYTAYAAKLGILVDHKLLWECYQASFVELPVPHLTRSPGKSLPPMSRDEVLGIIVLGVSTIPKKPDWNFSPYPIPKFNLIELTKQLILLYKNRADRNYFWENNLDQIYRFAFSVPLTDRHFILSKWGKFNPIYWAIAKIDSFLPNKSGGVRWLKYDKGIEVMKAEFPADHPFNT